MGKYAAYADSMWLFDLNADTRDEALKKADERDNSVTHVELISEIDDENRHMGGHDF